MIGRNITIIESLSLSIKSSMKKNDRVVVLEELATLIAVGIWTDKRIRVEEVIEGESIIKKILDSSGDIGFTEDLVTNFLKKFQRDPRSFERTKNELILAILANANYDFAEYIVDIFMSDQEIAPEEKEIVEQLSKYIDIKDALLTMVKKSDAFIKEVK